MKPPTPKEIKKAASPSEITGDPSPPPSPSPPPPSPVTVTGNPPSPPPPSPVTVTGNPPSPPPPPLPPAPSPVTVTGNPPSPPPATRDSDPCAVAGNYVDWKFVLQSEGQRLTPYVPRVNNPNGSGTIISPTSGVTVATGVDLHGANLANYNLPQELSDLLQPYTPSNLVGQAAQDVLNGNNPNVPAPRNLTQDEANELDSGVQTYFYNSFAKNFNNNAVSGFSSFEQLPSQVQTAVIDFAYQFGVGFENSKVSQAQQFFQNIVNGDWQAAINTLRNFTGPYGGSRRRREADAIQAGVNAAGNNMPTVSNPCAFILYGH